MRSSLEAFPAIQGAHWDRRVAELTRSGAPLFLLDETGLPAPLPPYRAEVRQTLERRWGRHRMVVLAARSDRTALRNHLANLTGEGPEFRIREPSFLRRFLTTQPAHLRSEFLGPIQALYVEGESPGTLITLDRTRDVSTRRL